MYRSTQLHASSEYRRQTLRCAPTNINAAGTSQLVDELTGCRRSTADITITEQVNITVDNLEETCVTSAQHFLYGSACFLVGLLAKLTSLFRRVTRPDDTLPSDLLCLGSSFAITLPGDCPLLRFLTRVEEQTPPQPILYANETSAPN